MMMQQMFKSGMSEDSDSSQAFNLAFESMLDAASQNNGTLDLSKLNMFGNADLSKLGYGNGLLMNNTLDYVKNKVTTGNISINEAVDAAAQKYGVDKNLILSVIKQESDFNPNATSNAGAEGLMQLMPSTASELGASNPYDIEQNVDAGTKYLKELLNTFGNTRLAVAAYNAGPNAVKNSGGNMNELPSETQNYVTKVLGYYNT